MKNNFHKYSKDILIRLKNLSAINLNFTVSIKNNRN